MEQLQIHSRSYIVRWVHVNAGDSISWSLQPHKKSVNFGIFKHPGGKAGISPILPTSATFDTPPNPSENDFSKVRRNSVATQKDTPGAVGDKLQSIGLKCVVWHGKCEADQVSTGHYDVLDGEGGMYGLVFDNTFSKTVAKTATFVLMTHPSSAPPKSGAQLKYSQGQAIGSSTSIGRSPSIASTDSIAHEHPVSGAQTRRSSRRGSAVSMGSGFYTGVMHKKRRKKNQGYARRFFSLDFTSSTLSYYRNSHASALRGSVPLALAAIGVNDGRKEFSIDSGAEVWHLRLKNQRDFESWRQALGRATRMPQADPLQASTGKGSGTLQGEPSIDPLELRDWQRVESLVARVYGSRDAVRRLAQDTDPKYTSSNGHTSNLSPQESPDEGNPFFLDMADREPQKLPFWKRKTSTSSQPGSPSSLLRRSFSAQGSSTVTTMLNAPTSPVAVPKVRLPTIAGSAAEEVHRRCMALLHDLDTTVAEFSALIASNKARRPLAVEPSASRMSFESTRSGEFFDAEESMNVSGQMISIGSPGDASDDQDDFFSDEEESTTSSDAGTSTNPISAKPSTSDADTLFPRAIGPLTPADIAFVQGRSTISPPRQPPPSIIGFLRKNAGKDLSTVAMPVTANEPLSLLQRLAEPLENVALLSQAAEVDPSKPLDKLIYVAAFAIATLASNRVKERAVRKPFNPMLGETFELVRHESPEQPGGPYRFVAEKVIHNPVQMAWQADALSGRWSLAQSPRPVQKFWGKSVELNTDGKYRLSLRSGTVVHENTSLHGEEHYSWTQPTAYLRNVIAGEKYIEPTGSMTIVHESTGATAVAEFKSSGLFAGRSEDVTVQFWDGASQRPQEVSLIGRWTTSLRRSDTGQEVWSAKSVVPQAAKSWGFSVFAARLNELTPIEVGKLPRTDSRLRPDQRALEEGMLDKAEGIKAQLEERQRTRRKLLESQGKVYQARFFEKLNVDDGEGGVWKLKSGRDGYWDCRERGQWTDVPAVFEV